MYPCGGKVGRRGSRAWRARRGRLGFPAFLAGTLAVRHLSAASTWDEVEMLIELNFIFENKYIKPIAII